MSTQLFGRNHSYDILGGAGQLALTSFRGFGSTNLVTNTATSGTNIQATLTAGGTPVKLYYCVRAVTLSGNVTANIRGKESALTANAGAGLKIERADSTGTIQSTVLDTTVPVSQVEYTTTDAAYALASIAITSTAFNDGDYIVITPELRNVGTMSHAASETVTNTINGPSGAAGDFSVTFAETLVPGLPPGYPQFRQAPVAALEASAATLNSPAFSCTAGDIIVVKLGTQDASVVITSPPVLQNASNVTVGSVTWVLQQSVLTDGSAYLWTGVVGTTVSTVHVATARSGGASASWGFLTEIWDGTTAQLAAVPVSVGIQKGATGTTTLVSTGTKSVISWLYSDDNSVAPGTAYAYNTSTGILEEFVESPPQYTNFYPLQLAPTAGTNTFGMSAPSGQLPEILGIEIQALAGTLSGNASQTATGTASATAAVGDIGIASQTLTASATATAVVGVSANASQTLTGSPSASIGASVNASASATASATATAVVGVSANAGQTLTGSPSSTVAMAASVNSGQTLAAGQTATAIVGVVGSASQTLAGSPSSTASMAASVNASATATATATASAIVTSGLSGLASASVTATASATVGTSVAANATATATASATAIVGVVGNANQTLTGAPSSTATVGKVGAASQTLTGSPSATVGTGVNASATVTASASATAIVTTGLTVNASATVTGTGSATGIVTRYASVAAVATASPSATAAVGISAGASQTLLAGPTASAFVTNVSGVYAIVTANSANQNTVSANSALLISIATGAS